jgi:hypothetical protein
VSSYFAAMENSRQTLITPIAGTTVLQGTFGIELQSDVQVLRTRAAVFSILVLDVDYTVPVFGLEDACAVTLVVPCLAGDSYQLNGRSVIERRSDYDPAQTPSGDQIDKDLTRLVRIDQELRRDIGAITPPQPRANGVLAFDANGNPMTIAQNPATVLADGLFGQIRREAGGTVMRIENATYEDVTVNGNLFRVLNHMFVTTRAIGFAALDPAKRPIVWLNDGEGSGVYIFTTYNATADAALDPFQGIVAKGLPALTTGAYVRQLLGDTLYSAMFQAKGDVDSSNAVANGTDDAPALNSMAYWCVRLKKKWALSKPSVDGFRLNTAIDGKAYMGMTASNERWCQLFPVGAITALEFGADVGAEDAYHMSLCGLTIDGKYSTGAGNAIVLDGGAATTEKIVKFEHLWIKNFKTTRHAFDVVGNAYQLCVQYCHFLDNDLHFKAADDGAGNFPVAIDWQFNLVEGGGDNASPAVHFRNVSSLNMAHNRLQSNKNLYTCLFETNGNMGTFAASDIFDNYFENNTKDTGGAYKSGGVELLVSGGTKLVSGVNVYGNKFHSSAVNMAWFDNPEKCRFENNQGGDPATVPLRVTGFAGNGNYFDPVHMWGDPVFAGVTGAGAAMRFLSGSAVFNPPSLATGASTTFNVTVTGAVVGDFVEYLFHTAQTAAFRISGVVSAVDTVLVTLQNFSGANPTDLPSGTCTARVRKP